MARQTKPLNNTEVKNSKATERATILYDGDGLELLVKPGGSKLWRFRYYKPFTRKRAMISFGAYPAVSLSEARQLREDARLLLSKDIDPQEHKKLNSCGKKMPLKTLFKRSLPNGSKPKNQRGWQLIR